MNYLLQCSHCPCRAWVRGSYEPTTGTEFDLDDAIWDTDKELTEAELLCAHEEFECIDDNYGFHFADDVI